MAEVVSTSESRGAKARSSIRFACAAVFSLALGLGVNTAIFSGRLDSTGTYFLHAPGESSIQFEQQDFQHEDACIRSHRMNYADSDNSLESQISAVSEIRQRSRSSRFEIRLSEIERVSSNNAELFCRDDLIITLGP